MEGSQISKRRFKRKERGWQVALKETLIGPLIGERERERETPRRYRELEGIGGLSS